MKLTDSEIKQLATDAGFWGVETWWDQSIPRFRKMLTQKKMFCKWALDFDADGNSYYLMEIANTVPGVEKRFVRKVSDER